jgi:hypothetical protein
LFLSTALFAQLNQHRRVFIPALLYYNPIDSNVIAESNFSLKVENQLIDSSKYQVNEIQAILIIKDSSLIGKSGSAEFNVLPLNLNRRYFLKDPKFLLPDRNGQYNPFSAPYSNSNSANEFFSDGLNKNGSISRGVSFGNNQNVVLNSSLNLQLSGKLSENINVLAAITDDNIPFQPQGNTQQLQEFDRVFIQLNDKKNKLIAGDFILNKPDAYLLSYYKRAQGANFSTEVAINEKKNSLFKTMVAAAVSKGKFARNIIQGIEGNQGPYRLRGSENELFIIVLSGTERIYIDGQMLTRGQENDYVIDYNTAEVTFTAKRFITKDRRIIAEFQYADKNYARSMLVNTSEYIDKQNKLIINYYNESDNKSRPLQQQLSDADKIILANAGDNLLNAIAPGVDSIGYRADLVLYAKKDSTIEGVTYSPVYYQSNKPDSAFYQLTFSQVGNNKGNYIQTNSTANGRVFIWVAPINGVRQGNYEPLVLLITPKRKQVLNLNYNFNPDSTLKIKLETAFSENDLNTFSSKDDKNNQDLALKVDIEKKYRLNKSLKPLCFIMGAQYEQLNKNFAIIERYRSVEFERDWNIIGKKQFDNQYIGGLVLGLEKMGSGRIDFTNQAFIEPNQTQGYQSRLNTNVNTPQWEANHFASASFINQNISNDQFIRQRGIVSRKVSKIKLSVKVDQERNVRNSRSNNDSLIAGSYQFNEWFLIASKADSTGNQYSVNYTQRNDWLLRNNKLTKSAFAQGAGGTLEFVENRYFTLKNYVGYRELKIIDSNLTTQKPDNNLVNRIEYTLRLFKSAIYTSTFYETSSGLELRKEYSFIQVAPGQGIYAWVDYNQNGTKELNEFEISQFTDQAQYIKVFTPTNTYIKIYGNQFNQIININPASAIKSKQWWAKAINYWSDQFSYRIDRKTSSTEFQDQYNPFYRNTGDVFLQSLNSSFRNTLFFNKTGYVFGSDYTFQDLSNKTLLVNGFESRNNNSHTVRTRLNFNQWITLNTELITAEKSNTSQLLTNRNYRIIINEAEPRLTYQQASDFRISLAYKYSIKENRFENDSTQGIQHRISSEIRYNRANKGSWSGRLNYYNILFTGLENSPVAYEIMEGLRPGNNLTWGISYQQNITTALQLSINYEGRRPEGLKSVHIGNVTVRAVF